jgi:hypothetical protein
MINPIISGIYFVFPAELQSSALDNAMLRMSILRAEYLRSR